MKLINVLNTISVEPFMHNEGIEGATYPNNVLVESDYVYPHSNVIG